MHGGVITSHRYCSDSFTGYTTAFRLQDCRLGFPMSDRPRTCLSGRRLHVSSPMMPVLADSAQPTRQSASSVACTYNNFGDRCFAACHGPRLWNTLPLNLRLCDSLGQFKRSLKTVKDISVWVVRPRRLVTLFLNCCIEISFLILTYLPPQFS